jgi:hypothetical protein
LYGKSIILVAMTYWYLSLPFLLAVAACQPAPPSAPLQGHWTFQQQDQMHYLPTGEMLESSKQIPSQVSYRSLDVTDKELIYQHVHSDKSFPGDSTYTVTRSYTRRGNMLLVVPAPGIEAGPVLITRLTKQQLTLRIAQARIPGAPYSDWDLHFVR